MRIDHEIEAGRKHIAPMEHRAQICPPQECLHDVHSSLFYSSLKSVAIWHEKKQM